MRRQMLPRQQCALLAETVNPDPLNSWCSNGVGVVKPVAHLAEVTMGKLLCGRAVRSKPDCFVRIASCVDLGLVVTVISVLLGSPCVTLPSSVVSMAAVLGCLITVAVWLIILALKLAV